MNRWVHILSFHPLKHGFRGYALKLKASMETRHRSRSLIKKTLHFDSCIFPWKVQFKFELLTFPSSSAISLNVFKLHHLQRQYINCHVKSFTKFKSIYNKFQLLLLVAVFPYQVIRSANIFAKLSLLPCNFAPGRSGVYRNLVKMGQEKPSFMRTQT